MLVLRHRNARFYIPARLHRLAAFTLLQQLPLCNSDAQMFSFRPVNKAYEPGG